MDKNTPKQRNRQEVLFETSIDKTKITFMLQDENVIRIIRQSKKRKIICFLKNIFHTFAPCK
jgi:hypothetical protein